MAPPPFETRLLPGDDRPRRVCRGCGFVDYQNPKVLVGAVATKGGRVLLCRRAIEPARGAWTIPAGHLERGESAEEGALREAWEEARAELEISGLLGVYTSVSEAVVHVVYRARLAAVGVAPGPESLEARLFAWRHIPWGALAFPVDTWALARARPRLGREAPARLSRLPILG